MSNIWQVQEARARFSKLLEASLAEGPQIVTRWGKETAVVVPIEQWRRLEKLAKPSLKAFLLAPEPRTETLTPPRRKLRPIPDSSKGAGMRDRLHLKARHRRMLEEILREHMPGVEVWAYGSRVSGHSHGGSDLDLVLRGPELEKIPIGQIAALEEALRLSTIPFLVEARDWARLPESFHREIGRDYIVLLEGPCGRAQQALESGDG